MTNFWKKKKKKKSYVVHACTKNHNMVHEVSLIISALLINALATFVNLAA